MFVLIQTVMSLVLFVVYLSHLQDITVLLNYDSGLVNCITFWSYRANSQHLKRMDIGFGVRRWFLVKKVSIRKFDIATCIDS